MKHLLALVFCMNLFSVSQAQIIGADTVCAGYIYDYSVAVPGGVSYVWSVPSSWYGLSGQGTSQISVTCNVNSGDVCVESFDSNFISLGTQCLTTNLGGGGGSYHLEPSGSNPVCDQMYSIQVIPQLVYDGPGSGGCLPGCGSGTPHPNIVWGIYRGVFFQGLVGDTLSLSTNPIYTYRAAYVDTSNGSNFPQAVEISGCAGSITGIFSFWNLSFGPGVSLSPANVCVGDTFWLIKSYSCPNGPIWSSFTNLILLYTSVQADSVLVVATGSQISFSCASCFIINDGSLLDGTLCWEQYPERYYTIPNCEVDASFSVSSSTICEDNCLAFTNSTTHATSYQWSFPGAIPSSSTDTNPTGICYPDTGFFDVTLIASNPDSTDTLFLPGYIHVVGTPQADFISDTNSICTNNCILLTNLSVNTSTYQWSFPGANPSSSTDSFPGPVCYPNAGTYDITLISLNAGCSDTLTIPAAITVEQSPQADFSASQTNLCPGSCIDFYNQSTNGNIFLWNFQGAGIDSSVEENPSMICYTDSGHFDVTLVVTNANCIGTLTMDDYISVYPVPPPVSIQQSGDTLFTSQGFSSYQWYQDGNLISGATDSFYFCTSDGDYNVVATDTNGCEAEAVIYNVLTKVTADQFLYQELVVYPNPAKDLLKIVLPATFEYAQNTTLRILDIQNRVVFSNRLVSHIIGVNQLVEGIYVVEIVGENAVLRTSFLKGSD